MLRYFFQTKDFQKLYAYFTKWLFSDKAIPLNAIHVQRKRDDQKKGNLRYLAEKQGQICEEAIVLAIYQFFLEVICFPGIQIVSMFRNVCFGLLVVWNCFLSLLVVFRSFDSWYTSLPLYGNDVYKRALSGCNSEKDVTENAIEITFGICDFEYCYEILIVLARFLCPNRGDVSLRIFRHMHCAYLDISILHM